MDLKATYFFVQASSRNANNKACLKKFLAEVNGRTVEKAIVDTMWGGNVSVLSLSSSDNAFIACLWKTPFGTSFREFQNFISLYTLGLKVSVFPVTKVLTNVELESIVSHGWRKIESNVDIYFGNHEMKTGCTANEFSSYIDCIQLASATNNKPCGPKILLSVVGNTNASFIYSVPKNFDRMQLQNIINCPESIKKIDFAKSKVQNALVYLQNGKYVSKSRCSSITAQ